MILKFVEGVCLTIIYLVLAALVIILSTMACFMLYCIYTEVGKFGTNSFIILSTSIILISGGIYNVKLGRR